MSCFRIASSRLDTLGAKLRLLAERLEFKISPRSLVGQRRHAGKVDRAGCLEYLPGTQSELMGQGVHDLRRGVGLDLKPYHVTLAPAVQLRVHQFQQITRFFLVQVQVAVAGWHETQPRR